MKLTRVRCTNCGADFENVEEGQTVFHCTRMGCGATFVVAQGRKFSEADAADSEKMQKLRSALKQSLSPFDREQAGLYAGQILAMVPEDFRARAALCLCEFKQGKPRALRRLLEKRVDCTEPEFLEMFPIILSMSEYRELMLLESAVELYVSDARQISDMKMQIVDRKEEIRISSDRYADIPRDVFICHSSVQQDLAMQVVEALEKDGNLCWISCRNLLPDAPDYWREIERAVSRCRVFLVLASEAAMLSRDVQAELRYAERCGNLRLELKLDETPHTTQFKYFFDGITWVKAETDWQAALPELKRRVYLLLHGEEKATDSEADAPKVKTDKERSPRQPETANVKSDPEQNAESRKEYEHHGVWYADDYVPTPSRSDPAVEEPQSNYAGWNAVEPEPYWQAESQSSYENPEPAGADARVEPQVQQPVAETMRADLKNSGRAQFRMEAWISALALVPQVLISWMWYQHDGGQTIDIPLFALLAMLPYGIAALLASHALLCRSEKPRRLQALLPLLPLWAEGVFYALCILKYGLYVGAGTLWDIRILGYEGWLWQVTITIGKGLALCISAVGIWLALREKAEHSQADVRRTEVGKASGKATAIYGILMALVLCDLFYGCYSTWASQRMLSYLFRDLTYDLALIAILNGLMKGRKPHWLTAMITVLPRIVATVLIIYIVNDRMLRYASTVLPMVNAVNVIEPFLLLFGLAAVLFFGWLDSRADR